MKPMSPNHWLILTSILVLVIEWHAHYLRGTETFLSGPGALDEFVPIYGMQGENDR